MRDDSGIVQEVRFDAGYAIEKIPYQFELTHVRIAPLSRSTPKEDLC